MKRNILILSIVAAALIIVFSCSKESSNNVDADKNIQLTGYEILVNKSIKDFKQKMEYVRANPYLKSGESVPADSVLWYLEATINYSHGFPNEYYQEFQTDSLTLSIDKNEDGSVDMAELTQEYDLMKSEVATAYNASTFTNKGLTLIDLEVTSETDEEIVISATSITGKINPNPDTTKWYNVGSWEYGENGGYCNSSLGDGDASEQFLHRIYWLIASNGKTNTFFDEIQVVDVKGGDPDFLVNPSLPADNHLDYYLYYSIDGTPIYWDEDMLCIPNADMNAYNNSIYTLLYDYLPNDYLPANYGGQNYYIISCLQFFDGKGPAFPAGYEYYHKGKFEYGYDIEYSEGNYPTEIE
ncbi:MAG: hypothetical protein R2764_16040 [Bacteroidales bacterium]